MLYLHCGWPRTGTSSLQAVLHDSREQLAAAGITYPDKWRSPPANPTHHGIYELVKASPRARQDGIDEFKRFLATHSDRDVLISAEGLTTSLVLNRRRNGLRRLLEVARETMPVRCVWTLRRLDEVALSLYLLRLRRGEAIPSPAEHLNSLPTPDRLFDGMRNVAEAANDVAYVEYREDGAHNRELLRAFGIADAVGASILHRLTATRLNASLSHKQATILAHRETFSSRTGTELSATTLGEAFRRQELGFDDDRPCELVDAGVRRAFHRQALDAAWRQGLTPYIEFFADAAIESSPLTPLEPSVVTKEDLTRLARHDLPGREPGGRPASRGGFKRGQSPVIQYWHSEEVPGYIKELLQTFRDRNPDMRHLLFNEKTADEFIAEHFGEREAAAFRACAVPAMQADYFRYCAIHKLGGVYADADFACTRPLRPLVEGRDGRVFKQPDGPMLNGLFAFPEPSHPLLAMAIEVATGNIERRTFSKVSLATGPGIFSGLLRLHQAGSLDALHAQFSDLDRETLTASLARAIAEHGPIERAFNGVQIGTRAEMLTWVRVPDEEAPYKSTQSYWANWKGTIFRPAASEVSP